MPSKQSIEKAKEELRKWRSGEIVLSSTKRKRYAWLEERGGVGNMTKNSLKKEVAHLTGYKRGMRSFIKDILK